MESGLLYASFTETAGNNQGQVGMGLHSYPASPVLLCLSNTVIKELNELQTEAWVEGSWGCGGTGRKGQWWGETTCVSEIRELRSTAGNDSQCWGMLTNTHKHAFVDKCLTHMHTFIVANCIYISATHTTGMKVGRKRRELLSSKGFCNRKSLWKEKRAAPLQNALQDQFKQGNGSANLMLNYESRYIIHLLTTSNYIWTAS